MRTIMAFLVAVFTMQSGFIMENNSLFEEENEEVQRDAEASRGRI